MWISGEFCRKPDLILQLYGFCETLSELLHLDVDIMMTKVFQMINMAPIVSDKDNIESIEKAFRLLWAKSNPYKQLLSHMIDTGCCAKAFLKSSSSVSLLDFLCSQWRCSKKEAISFSGYLAAMHDIGKATPQFQREDDALFSKLKSQGLSELFSEKYIGNTRHEHDSAKIAKRIWKTRKIDAQLSTPYACILSLHHQRLESNNQRQSIPGVWLEIQDKLEAEVRSTFEPPAIFPCPEQMDPVCILLTGLIILCDWVASSGPFDRNSIVDENYQAASMEIAENTLEKYGLIGSRANLAVGMFSSVWPQIQTPRDIQRKCEQINPDAPLTIIEAPMGEGKTEAALYLAERMCSVWNKRGIYIALPTQATSNQMYGRTNAMLDTIHSGHARLLHGTAFLQDEERRVQSDDAQEAERWLGSLRMGMLDENGVGTVDQAMAGVLRARFSVLRLLGLENKVLVIDELHAYDAYMSKIIQSLLRWCKGLRIPVILLSATLQESQRKDYISCFTEHVPDLSSAYPLITQVNEAGEMTQTEAAATLETTYSFVPVRLGQNEKLIAQYAVDHIKHGGCYCVLVNTVGKAQNVYRALLEIVAPDTKTMLFHARFPIGRREEIEKECLTCFGKGAGAVRPEKAILVATQVVEQSLDLDFDGMLTELAPIDLLLQRAGRVHRHRDRKRPKEFEQPLVHVILPDEDAIMDLNSRFGDSGYVYAPFLLNNTERLLEHGLGVHVPDDVRSVIAKVYESVTPENMIVWQEQAFNQQLMQANASGVSFPMPQDDSFFPAESHPEFLNMEVDDGFEPVARASTRLGEPTIRISFSTPALFEAAQTSRLTKEQQREIYLSSVSLSRKRFPSDSLESAALYQIEKGRLKGCYLSPYCDTIEIGKYVLVNDPLLGVQWKE